MSTAVDPLATDASEGTALESTDLIDRWRGRIARGELVNDEAQLRALWQLRDIQEHLRDYQPRTQLLDLMESTDRRRSTSATRVVADRAAQRELVRVLSEDDELSALDTPTGFLLTGPPGTGKSRLMDLFFDSLPTQRKHRVHYHAFLLSLYARVFEETERTRRELDAGEATANELAATGGSQGYPWSRREEAKAKAIAKGWRSVFAGGMSMDDPRLSKDFVLANVARQLITEKGWLLAFDELQLVDSAGAQFVKRVLEFYWRLGGVVVATSNRLPSDLYQSGIQRQHLLEKRCPIIEVRSAIDHRRLKNAASAADAQRPRAWFLSSEREAFEQAAANASRGQAGSPTTLSVYGRLVQVPWASGSVARFTFAELCGASLGPADYISIASRFSTVIVDQVPELTLVKKNEARRFITLLDSLYETKTRLIALAAAEPDRLFFQDAAENKTDGDGDSVTQEMIGDVLSDLAQPYRPNVSVYSATQQVAAYAKNDAPEQPRLLRASPRGDLSAEEASHPSNETEVFRNLAIFTGKDERFAYQRAVSRIFEMDSLEYWQRTHTPLEAAARTWERQAANSPASRPTPSSTSIVNGAGVVVGGLSDIEVGTALPRTKPPKKLDPMAEIDPYSLEPPQISNSHVWGIVETWSQKGRERLGRWAQGVAAYQGKK